MKCRKCGHDNPETAHFCSECGNNLEALVSADEQSVDEAVQESAIQGNLVEEETTRPEAEIQDWYYVDSGESQGPFSKEHFESLIQTGTILPETYVWTRGMKDWTHMNETEWASFCQTEPKVESALKEDQRAQEPSAESASEPETVAEPVYSAEKEETTSADPEWYYVQNSQTFGPFNREVMIQFIQSGTLNGRSYVWKAGMADWQHLDETELAAWLPTQSSFEPHRASPNGQGARTNYYRPIVPTRSVLLYLILSVITCGIFYIVWVYLIARDINQLADQRGEPQGCDPVVSVIFMILSCGIYQIYYFWKEGNVVWQLSKSGRIANNAGVLAILAIFLPVASAAILQDQINTLIQYD